LIELTEYAIARVEAACEYVDDSNGGEMTDMLERLGELHRKACVSARPEPAVLAERLFKYEMAGVDAFYDSLRRYAKVLGKEGADRYMQMAADEWGKVEPLTQESGRGNYDGYRRRITSIMENIAELSGDVETLVAVKSRDLSNAWDYLGIAEIYRAQRLHDQALEWAERGVEVFPNKQDDRLRDFLAEEYLRRKRNDDAMQLIWVQFVERPCLMNFQKLHQFSGKVKCWPAFRQQALEHLDRLIAGEKGKRLYVSSTAILVEIHLWEKNIEAAWEAASRGVITDQLWLTLAIAREKDHPGDALPIYRRLIEKAVEQTNNAAYEEAIILVKRIKPLLVRLDCPEDFGQYIAQLRANYKAKRNFMKLLDKL
jgi:tetratricopeptide (TPR) repeat protein